IKVYSEFNFESMHKNKDRIFMVEVPYGELENVHRRLFLERFFESSPLIEKSLVMIPPFLKKKEFRFLNGKNEKAAFLSDVTSAEPEITDLFDFRIINGDINCLQNPEMVMIPASLAMKLYETTDVIGKELQSAEELWTIKRKDFTIGAVYQDFPYNTQLRNDIYIPLNKEFAMDGSEGRCCFGYVLLSTPGAADELCENFDPKAFSNSMDDMTLTLIPLTDLYVHYDKPTVTKGGNYSILYILICIGILVLVIALINHTNLHASMAPIRIRSINIQKVLGCTNRKIRLILITESIVICCIAFLLAVFWLFLISQTELFSFIGLDLGVMNNWKQVLITWIIALALGVFSGLYPAYFMTSFSPALVLKGNFGLSSRGKVIRKVLVGFQLIITVALISSSICLYLQNSFMKNSDAGFDRDKVIMISGNLTLMRTHKNEIAQKLKQSSLISDVAFASDRFAAEDVYSMINVTTMKDERIFFYAMFATYNFFDVMGISIVEGSKPTISEQKSKKGAYVFNRLTKDIHDLDVSDELNGYLSDRGQVVGFTNNFALTSRRKKEVETGFFIQEDYIRDWANIMYVRMADHVNPLYVNKLIQETFAEFDPATIINIEYYDTLMDRLYEKEANLERLILLLTLLTILLAVIGLFGLVFFEAQYKRKEIAVRKVFGAETREILFDLNKSYVKMVLCCSVISIPITYWGVTTWLQTFAYRIPVYGWVFIVSATLVLIITLLTVTSQAWKASRENPVDSMKSL
ncbi:MAG: ABC transporter permease, partial [Bacteroidales bacterium]